MPQEAEAGKRFARDMRRIRESHNLTVGDLHDETKIPQSLIQAFEETGLFDHPQFNRVYLRSFVRTYANVVGVEAETALDALEDALAGNYSGSLAKQFLGEEEDARATQREEADEEEAAAGASEEQQRQEQEQQDQRPRETRQRDREPPIVSTTTEAAAGYEESREEEEEVDEDWASQSPPPGKVAGAAAGASAGAGASATRDRRGTSRRDRRSSGGLDRRWIIGGGVLILAAAVVWILVSVIGGSEPDSAESVAAADTTQIQEDTTAAQEGPAQQISIPAIGDTIDVQIIAAQGKVDPIRVTVDDDLRRPYWIDQGDSMAFSPANRIVIEELLDNINLTIEGIGYPTDRRDEQGRIVITRDTLQNFFASLQRQQ